MNRIIEVPKHKLKGEADYRQLTIRIENDTFMALEELTRKTELSRNKDEKTQIVYISSYEEYAMELFAVRPMNFVIKPITENAVLDNVRKAMELSDIRGGCFAFQTRGKSMRIPFSDIIFIESHERKIIVHTIRAEYELYDKLDNVQRQPYKL